jgi:hypothetical protein
MLDIENAIKVTEGCIRKTADLSSETPIPAERSLLRVGVDNNRIDALKTKIAENEDVGLRSLVPPRNIDLGVLEIDESSTVDDVVTILVDNAFI